MILVYENTTQRQCSPPRRMTPDRRRKSVFSPDGGRTAGGVLDGQEAAENLLAVDWPSSDFLCMFWLWENPHRARSAFFESSNAGTIF